VEALGELLREWQKVNYDLTEVEAKFKGTVEEKLLAVVSLEHLRNVIIGTMLEFYEKALKAVQGEKTREALVKSRDVAASTLGAYAGAAARLSSRN
jgi:hypothetical protein